MTWNIHYHYRGVPGYCSISTLEIALTHALVLLDQGADVWEVASSGGCKRIGASEIRLISARREARKLN